MQKVFYVGIGGFIGASLRYLISLWAAKVFNFEIPMGTLIVNIIGGFLIGFIMEISLSTDLISSELRLFITTGILGGLTTFSTFSYETINLLSDGSYIWGTLNAALNLFLSLAGVIAGRFIVKFII
ncbi:putative fluoride ion transporter CrcB [Caloramator mitchellensis]|uniref:Fluoride-specific ion channel FluC n=1 Tax=Caloramator mitchellensis TaxID=908809 RepID=A0A0R3K2Y5_CALMK|nr:fluoride efflux transporter CrcB [Caloramator mitchellensis]KRQ87934.1 putative fluoride ion transporter CrcB [Caloramator mitchellensis]